MEDVTIYKPITPYKYSRITQKFHKCIKVVIYNPSLLRLSIWIIVERFLYSIHPEEKRYLWSFSCVFVSDYILYSFILWLCPDIQIMGVFNPLWGVFYIYPHINNRREGGGLFLVQRDLDPIESRELYAFFVSRLSYYMQKASHRIRSESHCTLVNVATWTNWFDRWKC